MKKDKPLTDATWRFLGDLGEARAKYARKCPAISVEAAHEWGMEGAAVLYRAMQGEDPLIESIDGEPCVECDSGAGSAGRKVTRAPAPRKYRQEVLV